MELRGAHAFVTGGARRLGREICLDLARAGAFVSFSYLKSGDAALKTLADLQAMGGGLLAIQCDLTCVENVRRASRQLADASPRLDLLVNSASPFERQTFPVQSYLEWQRITRVSTEGCLFVCQENLPLLRKAPDPVIVNLLDLTVGRPLPGFTAHAVAKSGLEALTRQLAVELAPDVRVNGLVPGPVLPPTGLSVRALQRIADRTLLGRWGRPEDITRSLRFIAESPYMTGTMLHVDGGESMGPPPGRTD